MSEPTEKPKAYELTVRQAIVLYETIEALLNQFKRENAERPPYQPAKEKGEV
jgi:hypothetical protein